MFVYQTCSVIFGSQPHLLMLAAFTDAVTVSHSSCEKGCVRVVYAILLGRHSICVCSGDSTCVYMQEWERNLLIGLKCWI